MRTSTRLLRVLLLVSGALGLAGCGDPGPPRLAVLLPLSGEAAVYGEPIRRGILLAEADLRQAREMGLYPYDLRIEMVDTQGDPQLAARRLAELYEEGVVGAIGGVSEAEAAAMAAVAEEAERVLLSPTASMPEVSGSRNFYRLSLSPQREANKMASFAALELDLHEVAVIGADSPTAQRAAAVFAAEIERNGGKVTNRLEYPAHGEIPAATITQIVGSRAPAIYLADFTSHGERVVEALHRRGYRGVILSTSALTAPRLLDSLERAADGMLVTQSILDLSSDNPKVEHFAEIYRRRWQEEPDPFAAHGYDAFEVLAQAVMTQQAQPSQLWKGLRGLDGYRGVTGFLQFDERGAVGKFPRVYVVDRGRLDPVEGLSDRQKQRLAQR